MSNQLWAILIVSLLILLTLLALLVNRRAALAACVHNAVWAGAIFLIGTNLIRYFPASTEAWLVLVLALVTFNFGSIVAIARSRDKISSEYIAVPQALVARSTVIAMLAVYSVAVAIYLDTIADRFGLGTLFSDPASIRSASGVSYLESVPLAARLGLYLGPILIGLLGFSGAMRGTIPFPLRGLLLVLIATSMLLLLQRTNLYMGVLWLVSLYLSKDFGQGKLEPSPRARSRSGRARVLGRWRIIAPVVLAGILLTGSFQIVGAALGKAGQQALSTGAVSEPLARSGLTSPFVYYTAGTVAFLQLVDSTNYETPPERVQGSMRLGDNNPQTWGTATFAPVLKVFPVAPPVDSISPFIDTGVLTNVYTWNEPLFRDFRLWGVAFGMLALGFSMSWLFVNRFRSTLLYWVQAAFLSTLFLATFVAKFNNILLLASVMFVIALSAYSALRKPRRYHARTRTAGQNAKLP